MTTIEFNFGLGDSVTTPLGDQGMISQLSLDSSGKIYYVKLKGGQGQWFEEKQLVLGWL